MNKNNLFIALYTVTTRVYIDFVGRLMLAEVIALFNFPVINLIKLIKQHKGLKIVLGGLLVLFASQVASDIANNSAAKDYFRGWALIFFSLISTVYLVDKFSKTEKGIVHYLFYLSIINLVFGEEAIDMHLWQENTNYFKIRIVGFLNPVIVLAGYYSYNNKRKGVAVLIYISYSFICLALDARSNGVIFIITGAILSIKIWNIRLSAIKLIFFVVLLVLILYPGYVYYVDQVLYNNFGGSNARSQLSLATNPYNPFELLYYGRIDFVVLIHAILDKPFWGFGSWGKDPGGHYASLGALISGNDIYSEPGYIRAHSIFLGTWVYTGVIGFFASSFIFFNLFKSFYKIYKTRRHVSLMPILLHLSVEMLWSFLFSPLGQLRTSFPIFAAIIIVQQTKILNAKGRYK